MIMTIVNNFTPELANGCIIPMEMCSKDLKGSGNGISEFIVWEKINPTAAVDADPIIVKSVHPNMNEKKFPNDKRRYSYTPPDSSVSVDKPARINAPNILMTPASIHASRIQFSLSPVFAIGII